MVNTNLTSQNKENHTHKNKILLPTQNVDNDNTQNPNSVPLASQLEIDTKQNNTNEILQTHGEEHKNKEEGTSELVVKEQFSA